MTRDHSRHRGLVNLCARRLEFCARDLTGNEKVHNLCSFRLSRHERERERERERESTSVLEERRRDNRSRKKHLPRLKIKGTLDARVGSNLATRGS